MPTQIGTELEIVLQKLALCQGKNGQQVFFGNIRVEVLDGRIVLMVDDLVWETEDNTKIDTAVIRAPLRSLP